MANHMPNCRILSSVDQQFATSKLPPTCGFFFCRRTPHTWLSCAATLGSHPKEQRSMPAAIGLACEPSCKSDEMVLGLDVAGSTSTIEGKRMLYAKPQRDSEAAYRFAASGQGASAVTPSQAADALGATAGREVPSALLRGGSSSRSPTATATQHRASRAPPLQPADSRRSGVRATEPSRDGGSAWKRRGALPATLRRERSTCRQSAIKVRRRRWCRQRRLLRQMNMRLLARKRRFRGRQCPGLKRPRLF